MFRWVLVGIVVISVCCHPGLANANDDEPTFVGRMLAHPPIEEPQSPFVMIFHQGGNDENAYGLRTDGTMTAQDWQKVYRHVGHLYPYALVHAEAPWTVNGSDVCCRAAMEMGRLHGAGTMGLPASEQAELLLRAKYADPIGLSADYWFHDFEGHDYSSQAKAGFRKWCVDEVLAARLHTTASPPKVITNWMIPDNPGRLTEWVRDTGITHGNAIGYYETRWRGEPDKTPVTFMLHHGEQSLRYTWNDRRDWASAWLGNPPESSDEDVLRPDAYRSLVSLMTLQGSRWFLIFTAMSHGHLGTPSLRDRRLMAEANADAMHAMCQAASWIQPASENLASSVPDLAIYEGSAQASGNAVRLTIQGGYADATYDVAEAVDALNRLAPSDEPLNLVFSADIRSIDDGGKPDLPGVFSLRLLGDNGTNEGQLVFYPASQDSKRRLMVRYNCATDVFHRYDYHFQIRIVAKSPQHANEFRAGSFTGVQCKLHGESGTAAQQIELDNLWLRDGSGRVLNPTWDFDHGLLGSKLLPSERFSQQRVTIEDVQVGGRRNGIEGLPADVVFLSRLHPKTREYWFAGIRSRGSCQATVPLPAQSGMVTNLTSGHRQSISDGTYSMSISEHAEPFWFVPMSGVPAGSEHPVRSGKDQ